VFAGFRIPPEVITVAVRWYLGYGLSCRDVEELLAERGIAVDHLTIYRWVRAARHGRRLSCSVGSGAARSWRVESSAAGRAEEG
jgi:transposase-like protein